MHIGVDISLLRIAQAGVLTYHRSLLNHLVRVGRDCHFTLVDVLPLNPGRSMLPLAALDAPNVRVVRCPGIRRGYLSALPICRDGVAHTVAARIDHALDPVWARLSVVEMGLELRAATRFVEVFHATDQLPYAPPGAATVLTISRSDHPALSRDARGRECRVARCQGAFRPRPRRPDYRRVGSDPPRHRE
ncbi:MAG: hypothetical protein RMJ48_15550 [Roseiflexaceae bacterium]|nr:hypothetical protein [Roseiflexaceae bacterium]